jgi:hypothetical protein
LIPISTHLSFRWTIPLMLLRFNDLMPNYGNMAVKMAVVKNLVAVKGLQVAVNFGEGGSEGSPKSGNPGAQQPHSPLIDPNVEGGEAHVLLVWRPVYTPG